MRLNKYLSLCGVASRRKADQIIKQGRVKINSQVVKELGIKINPEKDEVLVNNKPCQVKEYAYLALNKPRAYVCTRADFKGEKSVYKLLPEKYHHLKIAGRLDKNSEGLLILSNDGDFIYRLTHPKFKHEKEYQVELSDKLSSENLLKLKKGVKLEEGLARFDKIKKIDDKKYKIIIHQGWKRQIRRMFEEIGYKTDELSRVRIGKLEIDDLDLGKYKKISKNQVI
ncbi:MAG: pseudouridine synthase [Patescibacteria group bacterium]|nr:pseudouridine synthase [Patescibacteria group bacterium]